MVQWDNHLQNSSFVNHRSKPSFSVISEALYLAQHGLTEGCQAGQLDVW